jgi:ADP-ribosylglycohydrolase
VEILNRERIGTLETPVNSYDNPASIASSVSAALFASMARLNQEEADRLGAEIIALTYGSPLAFLPGAVIVHLITRSLQQRDLPLMDLVEEAITALEDGFGREHRQTAQVIALIRQAIALSRDFSILPADAMEKLKCDSGAEVLAGAIYAALIYGKDFDSAMIVAVNHSGRSSAVGAIAGAILGARVGEENLPEFYLEGLEVLPVIRALADDLYQGCPMGQRGGIYDCDWDRKYLHGGK